MSRMVCQGYPCRFSHGMMASGDQGLLRGTCEGTRAIGTVRISRERSGLPEGGHLGSFVRGHSTLGVS